MNAAFDLISIMDNAPIIVRQKISEMISKEHKHNAEEFVCKIILKALRKILGDKNLRLKKFENILFTRLTRVKTLCYNAHQKPQKGKLKMAGEIGITHRHPTLNIEDVLDELVQEVFRRPHDKGKNEAYVRAFEEATRGYQLSTDGLAKCLRERRQKEKARMEKRKTNPRARKTEYSDKFSPTISTPKKEV